jgi:Family of unknown function (DUF6084)
VTELVFDCVGAEPERYGAAPTLLFKLRIAEVSGESIGAIALRCQIRIQPNLRRYSAEEEEGMLDLFGDRTRWGDTLKPLQFASVSMMVPAFKGNVEVDLPVACTYDFEVSSAKYFHSLKDGEIPLLFLFSGTVFEKRDPGLSVSQVPWHKEASFRLSVAVWKDLMDMYFPESAWIRMRRDTLDALQGFKSRAVLPTWDDTLHALLKKAGEGG